jgi:hypothetical protein
MRFVVSVAGFSGPGSRLNPIAATGAAIYQWWLAKCLPWITRRAAALSSSIIVSASASASSNAGNPSSPNSNTSSSPSSPPPHCDASNSDNVLTVQPRAHSSSTHLPQQSQTDARHHPPSPRLRFLSPLLRPRNITAKMALDEYYHNKIEAMKLEILKGQAALRRLEAQRNDYNSRVRLLREELGLLQQPGSYVGEVVKVMSTKKILVKVHPEGKYGAYYFSLSLSLSLLGSFTE